MRMCICTLCSQGMELLLRLPNSKPSAVFYQMLLSDYGTRRLGHGKTTAGRRLSPECASRIHSICLEGALGSTPDPLAPGRRPPLPLSGSFESGVKGGGGGVIC